MFFFGRGFWELGSTVLRYPAVTLPSRNLQEKQTNITLHQPTKTTINHFGMRTPQPRALLPSAAPPVLPSSKRVSGAGRAAATTGSTGGSLPVGIPVVCDGCNGNVFTHHAGAGSPLTAGRCVPVVVFCCRVCTMRTERQLPSSVVGE